MDVKLKNSFDRQLAHAINQSQEALQILNKINSMEYSSIEISECFRSELEALTNQINLMVADLKEVSVKALTLCENASSLMGSKNNIENFNRSLERFKSIITQPRAEKF